MKILFVCIENACRSQIAEEFFNKHAKHSSALSAGSDPASEVNPNTIIVLKEVGIDVSRKRPSAYDPFKNDAFDYIVTMGCKEECPITPLKKTIKWDIPDPKGKDIEEFRKTRDFIEQKIKVLLREIGD